MSVRTWLQSGKSVFASILILALASDAALRLCWAASVNPPKPADSTSIGMSKIKTPTEDDTAPHMGVYKGSVNGLAHIPGIIGVDVYAGWLGRQVIWAEDNQAPTWDNVEGASWQLLPWSHWVNARAGRKLILGVNILPGPWDRSGPVFGPDAHIPVSLEKGAAGNYNAHYTKLAENLVKYHLQDSILRLGIEFNGNWFSWRVQSTRDATAFAQYFRQIVTTMRTVSGARQLKFTWNPGVGVASGVDLERAWPGDGYVDYIGIDIYDNCYAPATYPWPPSSSAAAIEAIHERVWNTVFLNGPLGLLSWRAFAQRHHTPLAFPEWGLDDRRDHHGGGDDPYFITKMHSFMTDPDNNVAWHAYFDVQAPDGHHQLGPRKDGATVTEFPQSARLFQELFHSRTPPPGN